MNTLQKVYTAVTTTAMGVAIAGTAFAQEAGDTGLGKIGKAAGLGSTDINTTVGSILKTALSFLGVVAICIVIYGGFKYMTSGGEEKGVESAKKILYSGVIGLLIILSAYAITKFALGGLITATGSTLTGV